MPVRDKVIARHCRDYPLLIALIERIDMIGMDLRTLDSYPDKHPCVASGCEHTILYDDEPYCYKHSPDSGSSVRGYSYKAHHKD